MKILNILLLFACLSTYGQSFYKEVGEESKKPQDFFDKKYKVEFKKTVLGVKFNENYSDEIKKVVKRLLEKESFKFSAYKHYTVIIIYKKNQYYLLNEDLLNRYILIE